MEKTLNIGYIKIGGLGDSLSAIWFCQAIKRRYPNSKITLFIRDNLSFLNLHPAISNLVICNYRSQIELSNFLKDKYHLFFDDRYVCRINYSGYEDSFKKISDQNFNYWESYFNEFFNKLHELNYNLLNLTELTTGISLIPSDFNLFSLVDIKLNTLLNSLNKKYIVINNSDSEVQNTKKWPIEHWNTLITSLKEQGYLIYQIGKKNEGLINNVIDLRELLTFEEIFSLIKNCYFYISTEGFLPYVGRGLNKKGFVLFGATPIKCFGFSENINLSLDKPCSGCWYLTDDWYKKCPSKEVNYCNLLSGITPEFVLNKINNLYKR